ncbi:hypothetical protein TcarDRAFT_0066 [Thermosinus carboxydivorans Nor1]|uniref:Uncharacterized protein n=1 Tax=Thermosinus carboxydivorans Nor1 TaxID=401526 RepID=A1HUH2_9FIRM|nr:hypothetical protein [Thermosinus carboxydivorans]EAX46326.1 hypothetical protein TcarDRAFT_0066 [Thermosinus carboxydivorans Nor1]
MKKSFIICLLVAFFLFGVTSSAAAANWVFVGKLQLASGKSRTDYVDSETVVWNKADNSITFWLLSETVDPERPPNMSAWTTTKYVTKLDGIYPTRVLEWHGYTKIDGKVMGLSSKKPDSQVIYPEEYSLLSEAIELAEKYAR